MRFLAIALLTSLISLTPAALRSAPTVGVPQTPASATAAHPRDTNQQSEARARADPRPIAPFGWPLPPPHPVLRPFQPPPAPWAPGHRGVDLGGSPGESVLAAADGVVIYAGPLADRPLVSVAHPTGLHSTYEPVTPTVHVGQRVHRGDPLGHLEPGHAHCPAPACLHWGLRRGKEYLDPLALVSLRHVRLLPWRD